MSNTILFLYDGSISDTYKSRIIDVIEQCNKDFNIGIHAREYDKNVSNLLLRFNIERPLILPAILCTKNENKDHLYLYPISKTYMDIEKAIKEFFRV
jgi:hypothetical protein